MKRSCAGWHDITKINKLTSLADAVALFYMDCCAGITLSTMLAVTYCLSTLTYLYPRDVFVRLPQRFSFFLPSLQLFSFFKQAHLTFSIRLLQPSLSSRSLPELPSLTTTTTTSLRGLEHSCGNQGRCGLRRRRLKSFLINGDFSFKCDHKLQNWETANVSKDIQ